MIPIEHARATLLTAYETALAAVDGCERVRAALSRDSIMTPVSLIAIGKAACAMARGAREVLGDQIDDAFIVTQRGYAEPLLWTVHEAGHPLPDASSLAAGAALFEFIDRVPRHHTIVVLLSGGASALVERLPPGVDLEQLRALNEWLLESGRPISEMNSIRRKVSLIKGGRLAQRLALGGDARSRQGAGSHDRPLRAVVGLLISDVPDDDPQTIGSGPLVADAEADQPLASDDIPVSLRQCLAHPPAAPKPGDACFRHLRLKIVATVDDAIQAAARAASTGGFSVQTYAQRLAGDATSLGEALAEKLLESPSATVHVWGGEPTVRLPPSSGRGGRAQHLALSAARVLAAHNDIALLAAATDGRDGSSEDAGALVDGGTLDRGELNGQSASDALARADSGTFLEAAGDLIQTGPTGTNVMDIVIGIRFG